MRMKKTMPVEGGREAAVGEDVPKTRIEPPLWTVDGKDSVTIWKGGQHGGEQPAAQYV